MPSPWPTLARRFLCLACFVLLLSTAAFAQTSIITYQGRLTDLGTPPTGIYDLQFKLYDTATVGTGTLQGSPNTVTNATVNVTNGVFTVQLDFGASGFPGADRYLEINVRHPGDPSYTTLSPRQQLTSTPYAIRALSATNNVLKSGDTMTGALALSGDPAVALGAATKQYVDSGDALKLNLSGGTMTGQLVLSGDPTVALGAATKQYVDSAAATKLSLSGGTMSGVLNMGSNKITALATPTSGTDAANKAYVDAAIPTSANYVFAYDTVIQFPVTANVFQNITFTNTAQVNGWTYSAGTFTCPQTGLYLIDYAAEGKASNPSDVISLRAALNGTEVAGSQAAVITDSVTVVVVSKSFIANLTVADALALQFAASRTTDELVPNVGQGTTRPSVSVTIIRIQ